MQPRAATPRVLGVSVISIFQLATFYAKFCTMGPRAVQANERVHVWVYPGTHQVVSGDPLCGAGARALAGLPLPRADLSSALQLPRSEGGDWIPTHGPPYHHPCGYYPLGGSTNMYLLQTLPPPTRVLYVKSMGTATFSFSFPFPCPVPARSGRGLVTFTDAMSTSPLVTPARAVTTPTDDVAR